MIKDFIKDKLSKLRNIKPIKLRNSDEVITPKNPNPITNPVEPKPPIVDK